MKTKPFVTQKAQEICFALLRVAAHIRRSELRRTFERLSYALLENVSYENPEATILTIFALRNFVTLAKNAYEIELVNAKILDRELEQLSNEFKSIAGIPELVDLESSFTKKVKTQVVPSEVVIPEAEIRNELIVNPESGNPEDGDSAIRKEKILKMILTAPQKKLALKDITSAFPEVSERTIRYDLKKLFIEGKIIRQGSGGPSNYYTVNNAGPIPSVINL